MTESAVNMIKIALITRILQTVSCADAQSCALDWFGPNCEFQCHCLEGTCDQRGRCTESPGVCWDGWFGPNCQYRDLTSLADISVPFVSDIDTLSCLDSEGVKEIRIAAFEPFQFTFLRVVVQNDDVSKNFSLTLFDANKNELNCSDISYAEIDTLTVDIACNVDEFVRVVTLTWNRHRVICEINVSGGRNVALKQPTRMSSENVSRGVKSYSGDAVDGEISDCAVTQINDSSPSWEVRFNSPQIIYKIVIHTTLDDNRKFMRGFLLRGFGENKKEVFKHQDTSNENKIIYNVVVATKEPIVKVVLTIEKADERAAIYLCEFIAYGDCANPYYGLNCDTTCHTGCKDSLCHVNGQCFDCNAGLTGTFCKDDMNAFDDEEEEDSSDEGKDKKTVRPKTPTVPGVVYGVDLFFTVVYGTFAFIFTTLFCVFIYIVRHRKDRRFVHPRRRPSGQKPGIARHTKSDANVKHFKSKEIIDDLTISESLPTATTSTQFTTSSLNSPK